MVAVGAISFALAFEYPWLVGWSYFVLGAALGIHGSVFDKRVRVLAAKLGTAGEICDSGPKTHGQKRSPAFALLPTDPVIIAGGVICGMQDFEDDEVPILSERGTGEGFMEEAPATGSGAARRNEDIALDLMKFIAMTTGYGRTTSSGVGFQGTGSAAKPEDYATHLLELYGRCLGAVGAKK